MESMVERFVRYTSINTRSNEESTTIPSTQTQVDFATNVLVPDLKAIGLDEVIYNRENGFVIGTLHANTDEKAPSIGFIAHMDKADYNGEKIKTSILLVDSTFFTIFDFKLRTGQPDDVLSLRRSIVLTPETARRFFGNDDPKGRILHDKLTVSGIMEPIPFYSQFPQVDAVVSYDYIEELFGSELLSGWGYFQFSAYFLMKPHTNIQAKAKVLEKIFTGEESPLGLWRSGYAKEVHFVPLKKCYYDPLVITSRFDIRKNDASKVYILLAIVLLIFTIFNRVRSSVKGG